MPWNDTDHDQHNRDHLRYPGDLTDRAWALIAPMLPGDFAAVSTGRGDFHGRRDQGLWCAINHLLPAAARALEGREADPTAGVIGTIGLMPMLIIQSAGVQDRDGAA